jgi:hypothetical protein
MLRLYTNKPGTGSLNTQCFVHDGRHDAQLPGAAAPGGSSVGSRAPAARRLLAGMGEYNLRMIVPDRIDLSAQATDGTIVVRFLI